jgi:hypothetical protein
MNAQRHNTNAEEIASLQRQQIEAIHERVRLENSDALPSPELRQQIEKLDRDASAAIERLKILGVKPVNVHSAEGRRILLGEDRC